MPSRYKKTTGIPTQFRRQIILSGLITPMCFKDSDLHSLRHITFATCHQDLYLDDRYEINRSRTVAENIQIDQAYTLGVWNLKIPSETDVESGQFPPTHHHSASNQSHQHCSSVAPCWSRQSGSR